MAKRVTVIDIGSNSVRMVIYEKTSRFAFHLLHEAKSKVRISEDAYKNGGNLQEDPIKRTFKALENFLTISKSLQSNKVLCVATSALRDAPNKKEFLSLVSKKLNLNIKIIDGQKEAYYGAIACANLLPKQKNALTIDIGGGSTEFSIINDKDITNTISLELGTVRLKELFFDKDDLDGAIKYIDEKLESLDTDGIENIIGIGGTFRAITNAIMELNNYPLHKLHAYEHTRKEFISFLKKVLKADEQKLYDLSIKKERFDIIKPGSLILLRLLKKVTFAEKLITSGVGVREGVYLSDLLRNSKDKFPNNYNVSVRYLIDKHIQNKTFSNQLNKLSKILFDEMHKHLRLDISYRYELATAAKLYPVGSSVHYYSKNKHSYYLIQSALEYGFTHKQIQLISTLTRYAKKKLPSSSHYDKYKELLPNRDVLDKLSYIISLALALLSHRPRDIDFEVECKNGVLSIKSDKNLYLSVEAVSQLITPKLIEIEFINS